MTTLNIISVDGIITHYLPSSKKEELMKWLAANDAVLLKDKKGL